MTFWTFVFLMTSLSIMYGNKEQNYFTVCYVHLGCITTDEKWYHIKYRPVNLRPLGRHTVHTEFVLISKKINATNSLVYDIINLKPDTIAISRLEKKVGVTLLIHDFSSNGYSGWIKHLAKAILNTGNRNIISVDWQEGAEPPFDQAVANARVVALEATALINLLKRNYEISAKNIHLIGHGVGAHIAGYIGASTKVNQITGLDPSGPRFNFMPPEVRLDESDATYVEVLHTDSFGVRAQGTSEPSGHADFFINRGVHQPECNDRKKVPRLTYVTRSQLREGQIYPGCSHKRAFKYYIESVENPNCEFTGIQCTSYEDFLMGRCTSCDEFHRCTTFGRYYAKELTFGQCCNKNMQSSVFYVITNGKRNYCRNIYRVIINMSVDNKTVTPNKIGRIPIQLKAAGGTMELLDAYDIPRIFEVARPLSMMYYTEDSKIKPTSALLEWLPYKPTFRRRQYSIHVPDLTITLLEASGGEPSNRFCPAVDSGYLVKQVLTEYVDCKSKLSPCGDSRNISLQ